MLVHMLRLFEKTRRIDENTLSPSTTQQKRQKQEKKRRNENAKLKKKIKMSFAIF